MQLLELMKKESKQLMILNKDKSMLTWNIGSKFLKDKQTNVNQELCVLFKKSLLNWLHNIYRK